MQQAFWDACFADCDARRLDVDKYLSEHGCARELMQRVGDIDGARVLDLGCGAGHLSVIAAKRGADVVAVDTSHRAIRATQALAEENSVEVRTRRINAMRVDLLGEFDIVMGKYILHHIEPFAAFSIVLRRAIRPGGRAVFFENNGRSRLLMLARRTLTGRFGVARHSDGEEHPLQPCEIAMLRKHFASVSVHVPWMVYFGMIGVNVLRGRECYLGSACKRADSWIYDRVPAMRRYSYHQIIEVRR